MGTNPGWVIFLLVVGGLFAAYFVIGALIMYVVNGVVNLLNAGLWEEFEELLSPGAQFLVTCGRAKHTTDRPYDGIYKFP